MEPTPMVCLLLWLCCSFPRGGGECSRPLGLMSGAVRDWQLSASHGYGQGPPPSLDPDCHVRYARLFQPRGRAWCAGATAGVDRGAAMEGAYWLMVDLGVPAQVTSVLTQGRCGHSQWVTSLALSYSEDAVRWRFVEGPRGERRVFPANSDPCGVRQVYVDPPVSGRFLRLHVLDWHRHPSLRVEIVGCQECNHVVSGPPYTRLTASSQQGTCEAAEGHLYSHGGWCPSRSDGEQWLQLDVGPPVRILGVLTKGLEHPRKHHWVTSYTLSFSNDSVLWFAYREDNHLHPRVFPGNMDRTTERRHYLSRPVTARFLRIHPRSWHRGVGLRAGVVACAPPESCGGGFVRVTDLSACVPSLAYGRVTWVNDRRVTWPSWDLGRASLAVDGHRDSNLGSCALLDDYYEERPLWMVDLGGRRGVAGVVLVTWQGPGADEAALYHKYVYNLDRLTVYVSQRPRLEPHQLEEGNASLCAVMCRSQDALFKPRVHFDCGRTLWGRYVYIMASGVASRWGPGFMAVLCEVDIY